MNKTEQTATADEYEEALDITKFCVYEAASAPFWVFFVPSWAQDWWFARLEERTHRKYLRYRDFIRVKEINVRDMTKTELDNVIAAGH